MEEQLIEIRIDEQIESARFNRQAPFAEIIRHAHRLASMPGRS